VKAPLVIGLTGSIGMGKSTAAKILSGFGLPIYSADAAVHEALKKGGKAVKKVAKLFPATLKRNAIDRKALGREVFHAPQKLRALESILHPLAQQAERRFIRANRRAAAVILEIPLLFETGAQQRCDLVLVVTAARAIQRQRVLRRAGMTPEKFRAIQRQQMPDAEKRRRADLVVNTGKGLADTRRQLKQALAALLEDAAQRKQG